MKKKLHYAWVILIGCCALTFVQMGLITNANSLFVPYILEGTGMSMTTYSVVLMVQTLVLAICMGIAGRVLASGKIRAILIFAGLTEGAAIILRSQAVNAQMWWGAAFLFAVSSAFLGGLVGYTLVANWFQEKLGLATGFLAASGGVGGVVWNPVVAYTITQFGWRTALMINGLILTGVVLFLAFFVLKSSAPSGGQIPYGAKAATGRAQKDSGAVLDGPSFKLVFRTLSFWLLAIGGSIMALVLAMQQTFSPQLAVYGYSVSEIALVMSALMLGTALSQIGTGALLDKVSQGAVTAILIILGGAGLAGVVLNISYPVTIASAFLVGCGASVMSVALPVIRKRVFGAKSYGQATAVSGMMTAILPAIGMIMAGIAFDRTHSYFIPYMVTAALSVLTMIFIFYSLGKRYDKAGTKLNAAYLKEQAEPPQENAAKRAPNYRAMLIVLVFIVLGVLAMAYYIHVWVFVAVLVAVIVAVNAFLFRIGVIGCMGPFAKMGITKCSNDMKKKYGNRPAGEIIFYGASNFTFWKTCEEDMKPYIVQNHGFGGSTDDLMRDNAHRMLYPYKPSVVFIQTGSNDNARGLSLEEIKENKKKLFSEYRQKLPRTKFIVMSGLPVPGRPQFWPDIQGVNRFLAEYCAETENMYFIDATPVMTTPDGGFRPEYFVKDGLHLNQDGHDAWTALMKAKLEEMGIQA